MNLGAPELLIVLAIILLLFGSSKVPKLFHSLGEAQREFRKGATDASSPDRDKAEGTGSTTA
ncbi:MAG TPA: twin-arginine translocase TatA/TatE family subunit [Acidimicrobiales bacterium]